jgi:pimeloyl-ACP methyl ester carboxylesterase
MRTSLARLALVGLTVMLGLLASAVPASAAALDLPPILTPPPPPKVVPPVAVPIKIDPTGPVRGTVVMVHAGGWAGHDANAQSILADTPGEILLARGWRVVSVDYEEGTEGLADVIRAVRDEVGRPGPLCIYGESAGGHLSLVAASRLDREVDCVIALGAPTDLALYEREGAVSSDVQVRIVAYQINRFFGSTEEELAAWDAVPLAPQIHADVLLMREGDDVVVPRIHMERFLAARPTTQAEYLEAGDPNNPDDKFVHGTISAAGRAHYAAAIGAFADRAIADKKAERSAARMGCASADLTVAQGGLSRLQAGLRCLARKDKRSLKRSAKSFSQTSFKVRGEVSAARIWSYLRGSMSGRRALGAAASRKIKVTIRPADRSRVIVKAAR